MKPNDTRLVLRLVTRGGRTLVFLPDGRRLFGVKAVRYQAESIDPPTCTIELFEFAIEADCLIDGRHDENQ